MKNKLFGIFLMFLPISAVLAQSFQDKPFQQPVSKKYSFKEGKADDGAKLLIDRDDNIYVLTDEKFHVLLEGQMVENRMYRPLQGKRPLDVTIQDREGILYYLYEDHYLSNAHADRRSTRQNSSHVASS